MKALPWASRRPAHPPTAQLRVDPVACDGVGICAHLAPSIVAVDSWGYPLLSPLTGRRDLRQAEAAVAACPRKALFLSAPTA